MENSSDKSKIGGILSIISGALGVFWVFFIIIAVVFMAAMPELLL